MNFRKKEKTKKYSKLKKKEKLAIFFVISFFILLSFSLIFLSNFIYLKQNYNYSNFINEKKNFQIYKKNKLDISNSIYSPNKNDIYLSKDLKNENTIIIFFDSNNKYNIKFLKTFNEIEKNFLKNKEKNITIIVRPISLRPQNFNLNKKTYLILKCLSENKKNQETINLIKIIFQSKNININLLNSYLNNIKTDEEFEKCLNSPELSRFFEEYNLISNIKVSPTIFINNQEFDGYIDFKSLNKILSKKQNK